MDRKAARMAFKVGDSDGTHPSHGDGNAMDLCNQTGWTNAKNGWTNVIYEETGIWDKMMQQNWLKGWKNGCFWQQKHATSRFHGLFWRARKPRSKS